uniref:Uncharacterized protein n=1 Tax=Marseillevirus LCMAC101 TaxID=2506602 RepID=A0A481YT82_9VIRU|nr:MAG: uncharacterized protein LCMAC101_07950 [Marseillevirus LCMAC101]
MANPRVDEIYHQVLGSIESDLVDVSDLVDITVFTMQIVQKYPTMTGVDKKKAVIDILTKLVNDSGLVPPEQQEKALSFVVHTLPNMIDTVVSVYQHRIKLKKVGQRCGCVSASK